MYNIYNIYIYISGVRWCFKMRQFYVYIYIYIYISVACSGVLK